MADPKPEQPPHVAWIVDTKKVLKTADGLDVRVLELRHQQDAPVLSAWAKHFRSHYCDDDQIDDLRNGTGLSRADYLRSLKFPDSTAAPGPSIRSGDFGEILVADYLEFALGYWLPRARYENKDVRNESTKGVDILGFKFVQDGKDDPQDVLALFEAKAKLAGPTPSIRLQDAIDDSIKDELRKAESLNALKQRFLNRKSRDEAKRVERFQDPEDRPYVEVYGAVALASLPDVRQSDVALVDATAHPHRGSLALVVIHGVELMALVHELYRRAADEA